MTSLRLSSHPSLLQGPKNLRLLSAPNSSLSFASIASNSRIRLPSLKITYAISDEEPAKDPTIGHNFSGNVSEENVDEDSEASTRITDEWGEEVDIGEEIGNAGPKIAATDPPEYEDEWGEEKGSGDYLSGNETASGDKNGDLKRCLVDSFYGTELGLRASVETRAEIVELIKQLEAVNPTPAPTQVAGPLDGTWILVYTAFSELLPLLAAGTLPLVKLQKITQEIDTSSSTIENSTTFSSPFATISFSTSASFEVQSPSRIQVQFKEGIFQPPEISSSVDLPESVDVFGQKVELSAVNSLLNPLQGLVASISRAISGQPPLRVPIPGERTQSWLIITYLDEDLRISRGDGGLFVLVKEGSPIVEKHLLHVS
ncbi:probable plastid-lipid-associated protein 3, chloroplastic [Aristolochia californica]|uniref:probable plastid-lipid-associated protein 3, chloroplastic n=1 Tax=Aristolochia californica TaxID=171875 RepID=UPI0035DB43FD